MEMALNTDVLKIPSGLLHHSPDISIDIGSSLIKALYLEETKARQESVLHLATFDCDDLDHCLQWLQENWLRHCRHRDSVITITGRCGDQEKQKIAALFDVRMDGYLHNALAGSALQFLLKHAPVHALLESVSRRCFEEAWTDCILPFLETADKFAAMISDATDTEQTKDASQGKPSSTDHDNTNQTSKEEKKEFYESALFRPVPQNCATFVEIFPDPFPVLLVNMASDTSYTVLHADGSCEALHSSPCGGSTLVGLGKLLTGAKNYDEFMTLASNGDNQNVDVYARDTKTEYDDGMYTLIPDGIVDFSFGKAMTAKPDQFKKEDLAKALVMKFANEHSFNTLLAAKSRGVHTILFTGNTLNHPDVQHALTTTLLTYVTLDPGNMLHLYFMKIGGYLPVIGSLLQRCKSYVD